MGQRVIAENAGVESVTYKLPNKHYIPVDMKYIGVDNTTPLSIIRFWRFLLLVLDIAWATLSPEMVYDGSTIAISNRRPFSIMIEARLLLSLEIDIS